MALFKKKDSESEGAKEWEQTLMAEDDPSEGDSEFNFKFGRPEDEETDEPEPTDEDEEDDFFDSFEEQPTDSPNEPTEEPPATKRTPGLEDEEDEPWTPPPGPDEEDDVVEQAQPVQHPVEETPETVVVREAKWSPRRPETLSEVEREVDRLKVGPFTRPKNLQKWLDEATAPEDEAAPGEGMELIPSNIRSKRICYETEGGFVIEVEYRESGDVRTKYYTISKKSGRKQALAAIKSGSYARVTTVTDEMIEALKPSRRKSGRKRVQPGTVTTWPIQNKVNVSDIEGIGDEYQARLKEIGFYTTDQLRLGSANILASHIGVREAVVRQWQSQSELMLINGVGKQMAELLTRAGINGIDDLKKETPKALSDRVKEAREGRKVRITAAGVGPKRAQTLIREARKMRRRQQPFPELGPMK